VGRGLSRVVRQVGAAITTAVKTVANVVKSVVQTVASAVVKILPRSIQNVIASTGLVKVPEKKKPPPPEKKCKPGLDSCDCPSGMTLEDIPGMGWRCKAACGAPVCPEGTQPFRLHIICGGAGAGAGDGETVAVGGALARTFPGAWVPHIPFPAMNSPTGHWRPLGLWQRGPAPVGIRFCPGAQLAHLPKNIMHGAGGGGAGGPEFIGTLYMGGGGGGGGIGRGGGGGGGRICCCGGGG